MILVCPNCNSKFRIALSELGDAGRVVRCSVCGHEWLAERNAANAIMETTDYFDKNGGAQLVGESADEEINRKKWSYFKAIFAVITVFGFLLIGKEVLFKSRLLMNSCLSVTKVLVNGSGKNLDGKPSSVISVYIKNACGRFEILHDAKIIGRNQGMREVLKLHSDHSKILYTEGIDNILNFYSGSVDSLKELDVYVDDKPIVLHYANIQEPQ